jgi:mRNA interferase MazF
MVAAQYIPDAGDLIKVEFSAGRLNVEQAGHEQAGWRPAVVLSPKAYNKRSGLAIVVPVTNAIKGYPFEVDLPAGLKITGTVLSDAVRSIDWRHRQARYFDKAPAEVLKALRAKLAALIGIAQP